MLKIFKKIDLLKFSQFFMGIIFLSAALFRVFYPNLAKVEMQTFKIPYFFSKPLIIFEIFCGLSLIFNKYVRVTLLSLIIFMIFAIILALVQHPNLIFNISELFIFNPTPTDIFLHFIYLIILIIILKFKN